MSEEIKDAESTTESGTSSLESVSDANKETTEYVPKKRPRFQKISDVEKDAIIKRIATMYATGASTNLIAQTLNLHKNTVNKYIKHPSFMKQYEEDYAKIAAPAKDKARKELARLVPKAIKVIERNLEDDNLEAAKMVLKAIGLEQEEESKGDTQIVVNLPNLGQEPKEVESTIIEVKDEQY